MTIVAKSPHLALSIPALLLEVLDAAAVDEEEEAEAEAAALVIERSVKALQKMDGFTYRRPSQPSPLPSPTRC